MAVWRSLPVRELSIGGFQGLNESIPSHVRPMGSISSVTNLLLDPAPSLKIRPGLDALGGAISAAVTRGIHQYVNLAGTTVQTLAQAGAQLSYRSGAAWTSITNAAPAVKMQGANLNDLACLFWKGNTPKKWNGTTLSNLGGSPPQAGCVCEAYEQLFVVDIPGREGDVDFCDVADPETWSPAPTNDAGSITVSQSPTRWVAFDKRRGQVFIWTTREMLVLNGPETPNRPALWSPESVAEYGTPCGRTVQNVGGAWIWLTNDLNAKGFVVWAGSASLVYSPLATSLALIDWANIDNACSWLDKSGRYHCQVPKSGGHMEFIYDPDTGAWMTGASKNVRASGVLTVAGSDVPVVGDEGGQIYTLDGTDDAGTAIAYEVVIGPSTLGDNFRSKELTDACLVLSAEAGATVNVAVSTTESGSYGTTKTLAVSTGFQQQRIPLPVSTADLQRSGLFRVKVWGTGVVTLHDLEITVYQSGR